MLHEFLVVFRHIMTSAALGWKQCRMRRVQVRSLQVLNGSGQEFLNSCMCRAGSSFTSVGADKKFQPMQDSSMNMIYMKACTDVFILINTPLI